MKERFIDYFQWLEVHFTASDEVLKAAYRKLSQKYHPDNGGDQWQLHRVNEAYTVLSSPEKRQQYLASYAKENGNELLLKGRPFLHSMYDFTVEPIRTDVLSYLYYIKNGAYEEAYHMLSKYNQKHLFKKDFIQWQTLIAGIHQLRSFDCTFVESGVVQFTDNKLLRNKKYMKFRVKVIEENYLMGKVEEELFDRWMILDEKGWTVLLDQKNIKTVIKKYRKLTDSLKKKEHPLLIERRDREFVYGTGYVTRSSFLNNCEHEQLRFNRYQTVFSVVAFELDHRASIAEIARLLERNTRCLDSITYLKRGLFLILLPSTRELQGCKVMQKLMDLFEISGYSESIVASKCIEQQFESTKELLNQVVR